jgi:hypothetical protein
MAAMQVMIVHPGSKHLSAARYTWPISTVGTMPTCCLSAASARRAAALRCPCRQQTDLHVTMLPTAAVHKASCQSGWKRCTNLSGKPVVVPVLKIGVIAAAVSICVPLRRRCWHCCRCTGPCFRCARRCVRGTMGEESVAVYHRHHCCTQSTAPCCRCCWPGWHMQILLPADQHGRLRVMRLHDRYSKFKQSRLHRRAIRRCAQVSGYIISRGQPLCDQVHPTACKGSFCAVECSISTLLHSRASSSQWAR